MKSFPIGDILSVITGVLVSPSMSGVHALLEYMVSAPVFTHQLPRVAGECVPLLLRQHPQLATVDASHVNPTNWRAWLAEQSAAFGDHLPVAALEAGVIDVSEPLREAAELVGKRNVSVWIHR